MSSNQNTFGFTSLAPTLSHKDLKTLFPLIWRRRTVSRVAIKGLAQAQWQGGGFAFPISDRRCEGDIYTWTAPGHSLWVKTGIVWKLFYKFITNQNGNLIYLIYLYKVICNHNVNEK